MKANVINELFHYMYLNNIFYKYTYDKPEDIAYIVLGTYLKNNDIDKLYCILGELYEVSFLNELIEVIHHRLTQLFSKEIIRKALIGGCYDSNGEV